MKQCPYCHCDLEDHMTNCPKCYAGLPDDGKKEEPKREEQTNESTRSSKRKLRS